MEVVLNRNLESKGCFEGGRSLTSTQTKEKKKEKAGKEEGITVATRQRGLNSAPLGVKAGVTPKVYSNLGGGGARLNPDRLLEPPLY